MALNTPYGINRLIYKATNFETGVSVEAYVYNARGEKSGPYAFTELGDGLYYYDFNFNIYGTWAFLLYEEGSLKTHSTYKVIAWPGIVTYTS